jgi:sterol O-acyltransferase
MAQSTAVDATSKDGNSEFHHPRPRKPTYIELVKPQLAQLGDELPKQNGSASGISR